MTKEDQFDDGGPAFPISLPGWGDNGASGMSLRDYFAAKALPFACELAPDEAMGDPTFPDFLAMLSYKMADAMLKARAKESS
jgi:hypothetical protein